MKKNRMLALRLVALLLSLAVAAIQGLAQNATPKGNSPAAKPAVAAARLQTAAQPAERPGAPHEGIKVHGHWTIVVRNQDGTEVERREFENALENQGKEVLSSLLSRHQAISEWAVYLQNGGPGNLPCGSSGCAIVEHLSSQLPPFFTVASPGLNVSQDPADPSHLLLSGTTRATRDSVITTVSAYLGLCPPGPPSSTGCATTQSFWGFSGTSTFPGVAVANGQSIDVTVRFSFS